MKPRLELSVALLALIRIEKSCILRCLIFSPVGIDMIIDFITGTLFLMLLIVAILPARTYSLPTKTIIITDVYRLLKLLSLRTIALFWRAATEFITLLLLLLIDRTFRLICLIHHHITVIDWWMNKFILRIRRFAFTALGGNSRSSAIKVSCCLILLVNARPKLLISGLSVTLSSTLYLFFILDQCKKLFLC